MGIIVSNAYALARGGDPAAWKPVIGWHSLVSAITLSVAHELEAYPGINLINPATNLLWRSDSTAPQPVTVLFTTSGPTDYIGIARHNFGSAGIEIASIEGLVPEGDPGNPADWIELFGSVALADDTPVLFRFVPTHLGGIRINLVPGDVPPQAAVLRVGKLITLPNGMPPGHEPIKFARSAQTLAAVSEGGDYLGSVELTGGLSSSIEQRNIERSWYLANLKDLALAGKKASFFFAWAPLWAPEEVGWCWVTNDPKPVYGAGSDVDITFTINGIAI